jgi:inner membrane transporter RhtA
VALGAVSVQTGAAIAVRLFARVGPAGAVTLRLVLGAVVLVVVARPRLRGRTRGDLLVVAAFGLTLAVMNLSFYEAIARIPLGVAVTVEFVGPLAVAVTGSRRATDLLWAVLAGSGVALLAAAPNAHIDGVGVVFALAAGACWAGYILLSRETGRRVEGLDGLALALVVSSLAVAPFGLAAGGTRLARPSTLGLGLGVALLSSVLPYSVELVALRRISARAFGVLLSLDPAVAAVAGLALLGQHLEVREDVALVLVVAANVASSLAAGRRSEVTPLL